MRRSAAEVKEVYGDHVYDDILVSRIISIVLSQGKKAKAYGIVYGALLIIQHKMKLADDVIIEVFHKAVANARPSMEVKSRRVGGATYPVPIAVPERKSIFRALSWLVASARKRTGTSMKNRLADELMDAYNGRGAAVKKREDMHKMADANKAFAQYSF